MSEIARGERFSLLAVDGYAIWANEFGSSTGAKPSVSFCIVDRAWNHKEVWRDYWPKRKGVGGRGRTTARMRRVEALAKLDELEAKAESA